MLKYGYAKEGFSSRFDFGSDSGGGRGGVDCFSSLDFDFDFDFDPDPDFDSDFDPGRFD